MTRNTLGSDETGGQLARTRRARTFMVGALFLLSACDAMLPSDEEIDAAAERFEERERKRIIQATAGDPDDDGFTSNEEVDLGSDEQTGGPPGIP